MAGLIDQRIAGLIARRLSGAGTASAADLARLQSSLSLAVPRAEQLVAEISGISAPPPVEWAMVGRGDWAQVNIAGMTRLIAPLEHKLGSRLESLPLPARVAQRTIVSAEIGAMLGYISRRVLGQYDALVPEDELKGMSSWRRARLPARGASLYFVGPNMVELQQKMDFDPDDFALWVAVHEVTHRFQFAGVPWLRDRFYGLLQRYLDSVQMDAKGFARRLADAGRKMVTRTLGEDERNPVYLFADDAQRAILDEMQALMAVVEGHGNFVMDSVGEDIIPTVKQMRHLFEKRREQTNLVQRVINYAIGLEMKLRQYEMGQRFCEMVVAQGGHQALGQLWAEPGNLPTLAELKAPETWVTRVA